jgi:hypothetical protein
MKKSKVAEKVYLTIDLSCGRGRGYSALLSKHVTEQALLKPRDELLRPFCPT